MNRDTIPIQHDIHMMRLSRRELNRRRPRNWRPLTIIGLYALSGSVMFYLVSVVYFLLK